MDNFKKRYNRLNQSQRLAVDTIDGPLLVIAGPGTGKTELLSVRVANILQKTDTLPESILCLTFTESGAKNMQDRLQSLIGRAAYDVTISTYHAFGSEVLSHASDYIEDRLETPIDSLRQHQAVESIVKQLSWRDPLKQTRHHIKDLIATISETKRALLTSDDLRLIARENQQTIASVSAEVSQIFADLNRMPSKLDKALPYFEQTLTVLNQIKPKQPVMPRLGSLAEVAAESLSISIESASSQNSTKPLTAWKNKWLAKNSDNLFVLDGELPNNRLQSLAAVIETYHNILQDNGWFDFDDMILRAIKILETNDDLKYSLQEKYLYILLDEYQDTNAAQSRLVQLLADNPVHEGRPNIMAVGDDDQAIYAFQGAQYSNMYDFYTNYQETKVISLTENYRSHSDILAMAQSIASQINERLHHRFDSVSKQLTASNPDITAATITRREFKSSIAEYSFVANQIKQLLDSGVSPSEIAVLTPKHSILEGFVPHALQQSIPLAYEKRENILDNEIIHQILTLATLARLLSQDNKTSDSLWPEVLSYAYFKLPISDVWRLGWQAKVDQTSWLDQLINSDNPQLKRIASWLLAVATRLESEPAESIIDYLIGLRPISINEPEADSYTSPLISHLQEQSDQTFFDTMSSLTVLRSRLKDYHQGSGQVVKMSDLLDLVDAYRSADERMLNTSPYHGSDEAVALMTAFKAKGLEFEHVFLLSVTDETWGSSGQSQSNKLTLPANLAPTRHSGATEDERLRLLFVALTRAKTNLMLSSSSSNYSGKSTTRLKYLDEREDETGQVTSRVIPASQNQVVIQDDNDAPPVDDLITNWQRNHILAKNDVSLRQLLNERLAQYQLSPTDLNTFLDLHYGGPEQLLLRRLIGFPGSSSLDAEFGNLMHSTLRHLQTLLTSTDQLPNIDQLVEFYSKRLDKLSLDSDDHALLKDRGELSISTYITKRQDIFKPGDRAEVNFKYENVRIGKAHLTGTIDRLEIDSKNRQIVVVDYKTGRLDSEKRYKYTRQLYLYKLLIEGSQVYRGYSVTAGRLEFVEPDSQTNELQKPLEVAFDEKTMERIIKLISIVWDKIIALDLPDVTGYPLSLTGSKAFEKDLMAEFD